MLQLLVGIITGNKTIVISNNTNLPHYTMIYLVSNSFCGQCTTFIQNYAKNVQKTALFV